MGDSADIVFHGRAHQTLTQERARRGMLDCKVRREDSVVKDLLVGDK